MLIKQLPKAKVTDSIEKVFSILDPCDEHIVKIVKQSLFLYRNGAVYNASASDDTIKATVLDNGRQFDVELVFDFIEVSYCQCEELLFCEHKLATLFYAFSLFNSPGEYFNAWKNSGKDMLHQQKQIFSSVQDDVESIKDEAKLKKSGVELAGNKGNLLQNNTWVGKSDTGLVQNDNSSLGNNAELEKNDNSSAEYDTGLMQNSTRSRNNDARLMKNGSRSAENNTGFTKINSVLTGNNAKLMQNNTGAEKGDAEILPNKYDAKSRPNARILPYEEYSLENWYSFFNKNYEYFQKRQEQKTSYFWSYNRDTVLVTTIFEEFYPTLGNAPKPSSLVGSILFEIHEAIFTFEKILESASNAPVSMYAHQYTTKYLDELCHDIDDHIVTIQEKSLIPTEQDEMIISKTPERMLELLFLSRDFQFERFRLFQYLCPLLSYSKNLIEELEQKLSIRMKTEEHLKKLGKINFSSECRLALAHLSFLLEQDNEAINRLTNGNHYELYFYTTWVKTLAHYKRWNRFEVWLPFINKRMGEYIHQYGDQKHKRELADFYLYFIKQYSDENNLESVYFHTLQAWLPYSFSDFSNYLMEHKDYRSWVELQLFNEISIEYIDEDDMKKVESVDRSCLLPLYHNAIEEKINLKNRNAYRQAAKYLRKLRTHYRALKEELIWENYINHLALKYKRLRAFQEELRKGKGKLIND